MIRPVLRMGEPVLAARAQEVAADAFGSPELLALVDGDGQVDCLPLPIAGLMSDLAGDTVASRYAALSDGVRHRLGSPLRAPYMTLSFMALLVIPELKLSDRGLFDGRAFALTEVACPA